MKKNVNLKIVILFFVLGIVLILGLGASFLVMLNQIEDAGTAQENIQNIVSTQLSQIKIIITNK